MIKSKPFSFTIDDETKQKLRDLVNDEADTDMSKYIRKLIKAAYDKMMRRR